MGVEFFKSSFWSLRFFNLLNRCIFPCGSASKESTCNTGDLGSIPGLGRSPGEGKGYPLQYSGLENFMDCIVHWIAKSWTRLSDFHFITLIGRYWTKPGMNPTWSWYMILLKCCWVWFASVLLRSFESISFSFKSNINIGL